MRRALVGIIAGTAAFGICSLLHLLLGFVTGVIAMCQTAPDWWARIYMYSAVWIVPAALVLAILVSRNFPALIYRKGTSSISIARATLMIALVIGGEWFL